MNSYERYMNVMRGESADFLSRVPILMQYAAEYIDSDYEAFASDWRVLSESNVACARDFGVDQLSCISDPYRETAGFGSEITYMPSGPPRSTHPLEENKDLSILREPDPMKSERMLDRIKAAEFYKQNFGGEYSILGWIEGPIAEAADLRNVQPFMMDLLGDVPYACELMDRCVEVGIEFALAQIEAGADTIGVGDAIASQISPDMYADLILPREKRLVDAIHEAGAYVKLHICGDIKHLLPGIAELGIDLIDIDHMVDMRLARETLGDGVALTGNLDPVAVVKDGNPDQIRSAVRKIYAEVGNPYMINAGCEIPSGTPAENLKALCELVEYRE